MRHGHVLVTVFLVACSLSPARSQHERGAQFTARLSAAAPAHLGSTISFSALSDFQWDRCHVFGPYTRASTIDSALGGRWQGPVGVQVDDAIALLVFSHGDTVVAWDEVNRRLDLAPLESVATCTPDRAVFRVDTSAAGREWIKLVPAS